MSDLPNDLWRKIFDLGINNNTLTYKDLCSISITCTRLYRLSSEDSLWSPLLSSDFPRKITISPYFSSKYSSSSSSSVKSQYRIRFERKREAERRLEALLEHERGIWRGLHDFSWPYRWKRIEEKKTRKPTVADLLDSSYSTKANSRGFEHVPDKCYPRERRSKAFTQQRKSWHR